jgi:hypothetical protein
MDEGAAARTADRSVHVRDAPVFVLIHSPLLPPTSWSLVARELHRRGHEAVVPSLRGLVTAAEPRWWYARSATRAAIASIDSPVILAAHSAAGRLLPTIARALPNDAAGLLFVDAGLPPAMGSSTLAPASFLEVVRALERDGLKPSSSWFRQEIPLGIKPADRAFAAIMQERPRVPLSYFQERVPMPKDWIGGGCAYLRLSDAYAADVSQAQAYGWPVAAIRGAHHLSLVTDPEAVTSVLLELADELYPIASDPGDSGRRRRTKHVSPRARCDAGLGSLLLR